MAARYSWALWWLVPPALACSCLNEVTFCDALRTTEVVFLGTVAPAGAGPATLRVDEIFRGLPKETRTMRVDTGTRCQLELEPGERYVVYGRPVAGKPGLVFAGFCSNSFAVKGKERWLEAVRQVARGGESRLLGRVEARTGDQYEPAAGVRITAKSGAGQRDAVTNARGEFEFAPVSVEKYELRVDSTDYVELPMPRTESALSASGCAYQRLLVSPNGQIAGTVSGQNGQPLADVPVQVFAGMRGEMDRAPLQEERTDRFGNYSFSGLPPGHFAVAVNGRQYEDQQPWRPTFYPNTGQRSSAGWIHLDRGEKRQGIHLQLGEPRTTATLRVELVYEDGTPALGAHASIQDAEGVERAAANAALDGNRVAVAVFGGEVYRVSADQMKVSPGGLVTLGGPLQTTAQFWEGTSDAVTVTGPEAEVRVVLRERR